MQYDTIIIGAGAAGLFCAIEAGKRGRKALLIDKAKSVGEKIRISGGGRCNFTNLHVSKNNYLSNNPHFCISALKRYDQYDFIDLVEKHGIAYHEKTLGQLFCDDSAKQIIAMLLDECEQAGISIKTETSVSKVTKTDAGFSVTLADCRELTCESLVIATGGPSIPKMGATGWGYEIAKQFDLSVIEPRAALVPFTLNDNMLENLKPLSGISLEAIVSCNGTSFREGMLFTHRGLSGPAILQISSYWQAGDSISINLAPDIDVLAKLKQFKEQRPAKGLHGALSQILPKRLVQYICDELGYFGHIGELSNQTLEETTEAVCNWQITPSGTEGFKTAEVTIGGVDTDELSSKTFEANKVDGLYFIGEVIDVTGHLGGFNFQWAWSSGYAAGQFA